MKYLKQPKKEKGPKKKKEEKKKRRNFTGSAILSYWVNICCLQDLHNLERKSNFDTFKATTSLIILLSYKYQYLHFGVF